MSIQPAVSGWLDGHRLPQTAPVPLGTGVVG